MKETIQYNDKYMKYYLDQYCSSLTVAYFMKNSRNKEAAKKCATKLINKKIIESFNVEDEQSLTDYIEQSLNIKKKFTYKENEPILNYLHYWHKRKLLEERFNRFIKVEIDKLWLLSEIDDCEIDTLCHSTDIKDYVKLNNLCTSKYVKADTIFSTWNPIRRIIKILFNKSVNRNIDDYIFIENHIKEIKDKDKKLYDALFNFTKLASTRGNVIIYPYYLGESINFQRRGSDSQFQDLFLISLKECFDGQYSMLFENEKSNYKSIHEWINNQHLYCFFNNGKSITYNKNDLIVIKNDKQMPVQDSNTKSWFNTDEKAIPFILDKYTEIIKERNKNI